MVGIYIKAEKAVNGERINEPSPKASILADPR
jgi:hypothetical protein